MRRIKIYFCPTLSVKRKYTHKYTKNVAHRCITADNFTLVVFFTVNYNIIGIDYIHIQRTCDSFLEIFSVSLFLFFLFFMVSAVQA
jgi:hypothetical protein